MTGALVLYADGSVRFNDLDLDRADVIADLLDAPTVQTVDLDELRLMFDGMGLGIMRSLNLAATTLVYGSGRRPIHPIVGDVIVVGLTTDGDATDVPDDLLDLF